jgi:hypothetical protein
VRDRHAATIKVARRLICTASPSRQNPGLGNYHTPENGTRCFYSQLSSSLSVSITQQRSIFCSPLFFECRFFIFTTRSILRMTNERQSQGMEQKGLNQVGNLTPTHLTPSTFCHHLSPLIRANGSPTLCSSLNKHIRGVRSDFISINPQRQLSKS